MSDNNGWPDKPGVPLNPERDGWHWISLLGGKDNAQVIEWFSDAMRWDETDWTTEDFGLHTRYLGPCIGPAAERAQLQAENARLRAALTEVMVWINEWEPAFIQDEEWRETKRMVRAALGEKE